MKLCSVPLSWLLEKTFKLWNLLHLTVPGGNDRRTFAMLIREFCRSVLCAGSPFLSHSARRHRASPGCLSLLLAQYCHQVQRSKAVAQIPKLLTLLALGFFKKFISGLSFFFLFRMFRCIWFMSSSFYLWIWVTNAFLFSLFSFNESQ